MDTHPHLPLAPRDLLILAVLCEGPLHGYGMIKAIEERSSSGVLLDPANLYRVLRRMRRLGWVVRDEPGEARKRVYTITPEGRALVVAEVARLDNLLAHVRPGITP